MLIISLQLIYIIETDYIAIFDGSLNSQWFGRAGFILYRLLKYLFLIVLCLSINQKQLKYIIFFFLITVLLHVFKGQRADFFLYSILIIYFFKNYTKIRFNTLNVLMVGLFFLLISSVVVTFRNTSTLELSEENIFYNFFHFNSISVNVSLLVMEFNDQISTSNIPYLFAPIVDIFHRIFIDREVFYFKTLELLEISNFLPFKLIYFISPYAYFYGNGIGTSFLAEFYDFSGIIFTGPVFYFLFKFLLKFQDYSKKSSFFLLIYLNFFIAIIYMPRDSLIKPLIDDLPFVIIIFYLLKLVNEKKRI